MKLLTMVFEQQNLNHSNRLCEIHRQMADRAYATVLSVGARYTRSVLSCAHSYVCVEQSARCVSSLCSSQFAPLLLSYHCHVPSRGVLADAPKTSFCVALAQYFFVKLVINPAHILSIGEWHKWLRFCTQPGICRRIHRGNCPVR